MARILILEDDVLQGQMLQIMLERVGHSVVHHVSASDAMETLAQGDINILIADLIIRKDGAPVPDGGVLLIGRARALRQEHGWKLGIVAISGAMQYDPAVDLLQIARGVGSDRTLPKPFGEEELLDVVDELLAKHGLS